MLVIKKFGSIVIVGSINVYGFVFVIVIYVGNDIILV